MRINPSTGILADIKEKTNNLDVLLSSRGTETTLGGIKAKTDSLDLAMTALRDAIRGTGSKTLTDVDTHFTTLRDELRGTNSKTLSDVDTGLSNVTTRVARATAQTIYNVTCTTANTEYSQVAAGTILKFTVKARGGAVKVCFASGQSGTTYVYLTDGQSWSEDWVSLASPTFYFQSPTAGAVCEIVVWS